MVDEEILDEEIFGIGDERAIININTLTI